MTPREMLKKIQKEKPRKVRYNTSGMKFGAIMNTGRSSSGVTGAKGPGDDY
jgi:hypothetical protein